MHSHIDWHLDLGFAIVFAEDIAGTKAANPVPKQWDELCPIYNASNPSALSQGAKKQNLMVGIAQP
ncbi:hypothetical protein HGRIS_005383 [Hohenbuehelia grisea]|uniref:Laccase n=1 Tax=Hohenbuehelia grisea TaxID=104357 RepID=A0ABR3JFM2_9AGAR